MKQWHFDDLESRMYVNIEDGKKIAMPRYIKDKIYSEDQRKVIAFFSQQLNEVRDVEEENKKVAEFGEDWFRMKVEFHKDQFRKLHKSAEQGRSLF